MRGLGVSFLVWACLLLPTPGPLAAQEAVVVDPPTPLVAKTEVPAHSPERPAAPGDESDGPDDSDWWRGLTGSREPDRFYGGLWALHLRRMHDGISAHHLIGLSWRGFYGGTFVNSHDGRSWAVGIGRSVVAVKGRDAGLTLGYRAGLLGGYDDQLHDLAGRWPAIPAAELVAGLRYGRLGLHGSWAGIVTSAGAFVSFGR